MQSPLDEKYTLEYLVFVDYQSTWVYLTFGKDPDLFCGHSVGSRFLYSLRFPLDSFGFGDQSPSGQTY